MCERANHDRRTHTNRTRSMKKYRILWTLIDAISDELLWTAANAIKSKSSTRFVNWKFISTKWFLCTFVTRALQIINNKKPITGYRLTILLNVVLNRRTFGAWLCCHRFNFHSSIRPNNFETNVNTKQKSSVVGRSRVCLFDFVHLWNYIPIRILRKWTTKVTCNRLVAVNEPMTSIARIDKSKWFHSKIGWK